MTKESVISKISSLVFVVGLITLFVMSVSCVRNGNLVREQYNRTTELMVICSDGQFTGSGVIVGPDTVLTATHVVDCNGLVLVRDVVTDVVFVAEVASNLDGDDIAQLYVPGIRGPAVRIGKRPEPGDTVCAFVGNPNRWRVCGEVYVEKGKEGEILFSGVVQPGNSGSGVYNSDGDLVGIISISLLCRNGQFCGGGFTSIR